jgi:hypothetical protein
MRADIDEMASTDDHHSPRLVAVQHALVDLIRFLDPDGHRFPGVASAKIPTHPSAPTCRAEIPRTRGATASQRVDAGAPANGAGRLAGGLSSPLPAP